MISKCFDTAACVRLLLSALVFLVASRTMPAEVLQKSEDIAGGTVHYKVVLPSHYDPAKASPAVRSHSAAVPKL